MRSKLTRVLVVLPIVTFFLSGCVTETTTQSFRVIKDSAVQSSYIAEDADFSQYDRLQRRDAGIFFPSGAPIPPEDLQRIRDIFRQAFFGQLRDYRIVEAPGPGALAVQASIIDMRTGTYQDIPALRSELRDMGKPGEIVFLMELKDSQTEYVLGRAADSAATPAIATANGMETDWQGIEEAAEHWAALFRNFLDQNMQQ